MGVWPAAALLLLFVWLEVIFPHASVPSSIALLALAWTGVTIAGMVGFGADTWQRNGDVFAVYFAMLGRFAPLAACSDRRSLVLRPPGRGLVAPTPATTGPMSPPTGPMSPPTGAPCPPGSRFAWYAAVGAIVTGHVISVWLGHRNRPARVEPTEAALRASFPLTALMMLYTGLSLWVIADLLVRVREPMPPTPGSDPGASMPRTLG